MPSDRKSYSGYRVWNTPSITGMRWKIVWKAQVNGYSRQRILLHGSSPRIQRYSGFTGYVRYPRSPNCWMSAILTLTLFFQPERGKQSSRNDTTKIFYTYASLLTWGSSSTVIDRLIRQQEKSSSNSQALAYFYCRRDETGSTDPELVMSTIVKQLSCLRAGLALQTAVLSVYKAKKAAGFSSNSLAFQESLDIILSLTSIYSQITIVVDALDECDPLKRQRFLSSLEVIVGSSSGLVKIFVSSRDDNDIVRRLNGVPNLWIEAKDNRNDIQRFVQREIGRCITQGDLLNGVVNDEMRTRIIETLIDKSQGMYT